MATIPWLDDNEHNFPSLDNALNEPNGLLAVGGDLSPARLIAAYRAGIFPWYEEHQPILWWSPSPRAVLFPAKINVSKSLHKRLRRNDYRISCNQRFKEVMTNCALTPRKNQGGTWINPDMIDAYSQLNKMGVAHSLEAWHQDQLVGGLYGLSIGKVFFGESMFSLMPDASKVAFVHLARQLEAWDYALIDCQVSSPHLFTLGAEEIEREHFTGLLTANINTANSVYWPPDWSFS